MGLIQRQGLKYSIVNWGGVFIGALSTMFIFPRALEEYGLIRFILDTSMLLFPLLSFGINSVIIRFFPYFEDNKRKHNGFLGIILIWGGISYCLCMLLFLGVGDSVFAFYSSKGALFNQYLWILLPTMFFTTLNTILNQYSICFKRIVVPSLLFDVSQKIALPALVISYLAHWISLSTMLYLLLLYLGFVSVGFVAYIIHLKAFFVKPNFQKLTPKLRREMASYALFGLVGGVGFLLVSRFDSWLVSTMIGLKNNGIYAISAFIANTMEVPSRAVIGLSLPLISRYWKDNNTAEIASLYKKASINLLIMALLIFGIFWSSVDAFFMIIANSKEMETGKMVVLLLGLGRIVDMATGINNYILNYSRYFVYSYIQILIPAIISVILGLWLTPLYGMVGAAISILCSTSIYNAISIILNWHFFKIQPFTRKFGSIILSAIVAFLCAQTATLLPTHWLLNAVLVSGIFSTLFVYAIWKMQLSDEVVHLINKTLKKI